MSTDVFISYAHAGGAIEHIRALAKRLSSAAANVFLDERTIPLGSAFPHDIADALMQARQVIIFIDDLYFTRPWCVYELQVITAPYLSAPIPTSDLLGYVTVVLPDAGDVEALVTHLPPPIARASWPSAGQTDAIAELVMKRRQSCTQSMRERLNDVNDDAVKRLRSGADVPLAWAPVEASKASTPPPTRPWSIELAPESRGAEFIGRAVDLWRVFHHMVTCRAFTGVHSCGIQGPGGSGKSQLAAEFVARYGRRFYPGGVVWISANSDLEALSGHFRRVLAAIVPGHEMPVEEVTDPQRQRELLAQELVRHCKAWPYSRQMLWVVDDVPEPAAGEHSKPLSYWCPVLQEVNLLTTSRRTRVGNMLAYVTLGGLSLNDAVDWLTRPEVDRRWLKESDWEDIARWVGCLPLAIALLRTSLMDGYTTTKALQLARVQEPSLMLDKEMTALRGEVDDERLRGVTEAFDFSYSVLAKDPTLQHAAHLVACLAPHPLADHLLADLVGIPTMGKLAKRSWIQRSAREALDLSERHYVMHRIPASFLRVRMTDPQMIFRELFHWLERSSASDKDKQDLRVLDYHLMVIEREFVSLLRSLPEDAPVIAVARDFAVQSASDATSHTTRGYRFLAAGLAHRLGAGDEVAERLAQHYDGGDLDTAAAIPHILQALPGSAKASALMARLLEDGRWQVSYQAIIFAGQLMDLDLAQPLLDTIMHTDMEKPEHYFAVYLHQECPLLRNLLSDIARYLNEGTSTQRTRAAGLLGLVLKHNGRNLKAGGWSSRQLVGGLLRVALEDKAPEVVEAAVHSAASYFDAEAYASLVDALYGEHDAPKRSRLLQIMGDYLYATGRTTPRLLKQQFLDEGGVRFELDLGQQREALPNGVYEPLITEAYSADEKLGNIAMAGVMRTNEGLQALGNAAHQLLDQQAYESVRILGARAIAQDPEFTNGNWWRGQARLELGDVAGALVDFERVLEKTPDFIDAHYWRGRAREMLGDTQGAMDDYNLVIETDPDFVHAFYYRGLLRRDAQDVDGAVADLATVIAKTDDWQDAYYQHGVLLCQRRTFAEALPSLQHAAELAPDDFYAQHMLAFCLYNLQQNIAAEAAASHAIALNPNVGETWFFRAVARYAEGKATEALADLRQALRLDPGDERVTEFTKQLEDYLEGQG